MELTLDTTLSSYLVYEWKEAHWGLTGLFGHTGRGTQLFQIAAQHSPHTACFSYRSSPTWSGLNTTLLCPFYFISFFFKTDTTYWAVSRSVTAEQGQEQSFQHQLPALWCVYLLPCSFKTDLEQCAKTTPEDALHGLPTRPPVAATQDVPGFKYSTSLYS